MLALTRNVNESIMIYTSDGPIEVIIRQVNGMQVRVGFIAPQSVNIVRKEIDAKPRSQQLLAQGTP